MVSNIKSFSCGIIVEEDKIGLGEGLDIGAIVLAAGLALGVGVREEVAQLEMSNKKATVQETKAIDFLINIVASV